MEIFGSLTNSLEIYSAQKKKPFFLTNRETCNAGQKLPENKCVISQSFTISLLQEVCYMLVIL